MWRIYMARQKRIRADIQGRVFKHGPYKVYPARGCVRAICVISVVSLFPLASLSSASWQLEHRS
jgi:hypothetical protein